MAQSSILMLWSVLLNNYCYSRLWGRWLDQEAIVTSSFRDNIIYGCAAYKSLITILFTTHCCASLLYVCIAAGESLTLAYLLSFEYDPKQSKLERSGKCKIKLTSKSCRRFLHTILAVLPKVRLNLGLVGKKLTILQSIIRIEGISYQNGWHWKYMEPPCVVLVISDNPYGFCIELCL